MTESPALQSEKVLGYGVVSLMQRVHLNNSEASGGGGVTGPLGVSRGVVELDVGGRACVDRARSRACSRCLIKLGPRGVGNASGSLLC